MFLVYFNHNLRMLMKQICSQCTDIEVLIYKYFFIHGTNAIHLYGKYFATLEYTY